MPAASKPQHEEARVKLVLFGPPAGQYEKGPCIVLAGDDVGDVLELTATFFDRDDVVDDLRAIFDLKRATAIVAAGLDAQPVGEPEASAPTPIKKNVRPPVLDTCPECGKGQLVKKNRKDGSGTFTGCNNFPNCRYIAKGR